MKETVLVETKKTEKGQEDGDRKSSSSFSSEGLPKDSAGTLETTPSLSVSERKAREMLVSNLYREHAAFVWHLLQRFGVTKNDLEDALQETFLVVYRKLGDFHDSEPIKPWLYGIAFKVAAKFSRKVYHAYEVAKDDLTSIPSREDSPEEHLSRKSDHERFHQIVLNLNEDKRAVFLMYEVEGLSQEEIATELSIPVGTVCSRLYYARKEFLNALKLEEKKGARP